MEMADKLIAGKFHDEEDEEPDEEEHQHDLGKPTDQAIDLEHHVNYGRLEQAEMALQEQRPEDEAVECNHKHKGDDEIPQLLRKELELPENMEHFNIDFLEVRRKDAFRKKLRPVWSGQDVIPDSLNSSKSYSVVEQMNAIRVWPAGPRGIVKRIRFLLRLHVNSSLFDNSMTLLVLLNTVTLSMDWFDQR